MKDLLHKHGTSIVLALVAVVLGVWLWMDRSSVTDTERTARPKNLLSAFRRDELSRIEIAKGTEKLVLARDVDRDADAAWRMESPESGLADANAVEQLVSAFEFGTFIRKVEPKSAPTFDAPRATGSVAMGKLVYRFALGPVSPTPEGSSYFKVDDAGVFVVSKEFAEQLLKGAAVYKSRTIVPYLSLDLASLDIHGRSGDLHIERTGDLTFKVGDAGLRASREGLDKLWSAFAEMRAESFATADVTAPDVTITMTPKNGKPRGVILIGGACPEHPDDVIVVRTEPTRLAACAPKGILEGLAMTAADLADTRLFFAHEDELEDLTLTNADGSAKVELARKGSGWHARAPFDRDLAGDEVDAANALASAVIRAKGTSVSKFSASEPFALRAHVRLHGGEMQGDESVDVGEGASHAMVAHRASDDARIELTAEVARKLMPSKISLKGRDVISPALDAKDVSTLTLRCGTSQDLAREGANPWKLASPSGYVADQAGALDLVDQVARLRADSWIADADDGSFGIATSTCVVTLGAKGRTVKLALGRAGEGGIYAMVTDSAGGTSPVFLEPRVFRDSLSRILIDRSVLAFDAKQSTELVLSLGTKKLTLVYRQGAWSTTGIVSAEAPEAIASALEGLRADDVVHLGPPAQDEGFATPFEVRADLEGDAGKRTVHVRFGRDVLRKNQTMVFTRIDGIDATFAVARERVDPIRNAL